jgi:hypothetical protein
VVLDENSARNRGTWWTGFGVYGPRLHAVLPNAHRYTHDGYDLRIALCGNPVKPPTTENDLNTPLCFKCLYSLDRYVTDQAAQTESSTPTT